MAPRVTRLEGDVVACSGCGSKEFVLVHYTGSGTPLRERMAHNGELELRFDMSRAVLEQQRRDLFCGGCGDQVLVPSSVTITAQAD